jgi:hypothetical protein
MTVNPEIQQKAERLRQQAQTSAPWLDGYDLVHLVDAVMQAVNTPAPDFNQIGEQLNSLAETVQGIIPDNLDAGEALQPLLESIGDLLGSLGDLGS